MGKPPELEVGRSYLGVVLFRCALTVFFSLAASFVVGVGVVAFGVFSNSQAVSISAECRVVSSGVDLRSAKVCELGASNYKANHVIYSSEKLRVRCRDDYYWASIFHVEYKEYFSGQMLRAVAEAPKEALPLDCRPSFSAALLTKSKFKVNETYKCRYIPGVYKADIYQDGFFNCEAKHPSSMEVIRRLLILFVDSFLLDEGRGARAMLNSATGFVIGLLFSGTLIITVHLLEAFKIPLLRNLDAVKNGTAILFSHFRRACILVAYFSIMGWLTLQYTKAIGLKQLFFQH